MIRLFLYANLMFIWGMFALNRRSAMKWLKGYILGVWIPKENAQDESVIAIIKSYQQCKKKALVFPIFLAIPMLLPTAYFSITFSTFMLGLIALLVLDAVMYSKAHQNMKQLKKSRGWYKEATGEVYVDTKLSQEVKLPRFGFLWWAGLVLLSVLPWFIKVEVSKGLAYVLIAASLGIVMLGAFVMRAFRQLSYRVYSSDFQSNLMLNQRIRSEWLSGIMGLMYVTVLGNTVLYFFAHQMAALQKTGWYMMILFLTVLPVFFMLWLSMRHRAYTEATLLGKDIIEQPDEDYWILGLFYNNPRVRKMFINRPYGMGSTVNLATKGGKLYVFGSAILCVAIIVPLWFGMIMDDVTPHQMVFLEDQFTVKSTFYAMTMAYEDIESLEWVDPPHGGFKSNGVATSRYARGHFYYKEFGDVHAYVFKDSTPYLLISSKSGKALLFSGHAQSDTLMVYEALMGHLTQK